MKEYLSVSSFKVIRTSDNTEVTKRKTQSTFSKNTVLKSRQSTASLHSFFANFSTQCNATLRQPEIVSFAIP